MPGSGHVAWFELSLPTAGQSIDNAPSKETVAVADSTNQQSAVKLNILLAEDNLVNQEVMKGLIAKFGDNMDIAQNGQEALEMFKEGQYDLILMDINMPVMNGLEASKQIRALDADIPIVAVTANTMLEDRNNCLEHGMNSVETKPINSEKLKRVLDTYRINTDGEDALSVNDAGFITSKPEVAETITENISTEPAEPAIDQNFLDGLTKELGIETIKNLLGMYTRDAPPLVEQIKTEVVEAHTHSHTLAGMSENLGIVGVGKVSREIMVVQSDSELQQLAIKLNDKLEQAMMEISEFTAKH
jgi:CheY-like chemotaxis protein